MNKGFGQKFTIIVFALLAAISPIGVLCYTGASVANNGAYLTIYISYIIIIIALIIAGVRLKTFNVVMPILYLTTLFIGWGYYITFDEIEKNDGSIFFRAGLFVIFIISTIFIIDSYSPKPDYKKADKNKEDDYQINITDECKNKLPRNDVVTVIIDKDAPYRDRFQQENGYFKIYFDEQGYAKAFVGDNKFFSKEKQEVIINRINARIKTIKEETNDESS